MSNTHRPQRQIAYLTRDEALEQVAPSSLGLLTAILVLALIAGGVTWTAYVSITTVASAPGEIIPSGDERVVQHLEGGIVREISVLDGAIVEQGETLLTFEPTLRQTELDQIRAREAALLIRERRLRALIDGTAGVDYRDLADTYPELVEEATISLTATRERIDGQIAVLEAQISQRRRSVEIFGEQVASLEQQLALVTETVDLQLDLVRRGVGTRVNLIAAQLEQSRVRGAMMEAQVSAEQAEISIAEAESQITELLLNERSTAMEDLSGVLAELAEVKGNRERLEDRVNRLVVTSPVAGVVHRLQVNTPGEVVEPAEVLMTIVPLDEDVVADIRLNPADIGHVEVGQEVRLTVSGFDVRRYGLVAGELEQISATTYESETGETFFRGRVLMEQMGAGENGIPLQIVPGMTVQADISTGSQTLLQYLSKPIYDALRNAFSER